MGRKPVFAVLALTGGMWLLIGTPAGGLSQHALAPGGGSRHLETLTVPPSGTLVASRTTLNQGESYRLVLTGAVTTSFNGKSDRLDALYCYESFGPGANADPIASCTTNVRRHPNLTAGIGQPAPGFLDQLDPNLHNRIPYQPSHRYEFSFRAKRSGKLTFKFFTILAQKSGAYKIDLYGQPPRKKARRPKRQPKGCRARASTGPTATAASCLWVVNFTVTQKGLPTRSFPAPPAGFTTSQTDAVGKIFFNAKPKEGRSAAGSAAGLIVHTDTYQSPINPFSFEEGQFIVKVVRGFYRHLPGGPRVNLEGKVTSVSGRKYGSDPHQPGDNAAFGLLFDAPTHQHDSFVLNVACSGCPRPGVLQRYFASPEDKLTVTVSAPHPR